MSFLDEAEEKQRRRAQGQRGKDAEDEVKQILIELGHYPDFDWERIPDARTAGGKFPARPGDFGFFTKKAHGLIEVKELKHPFRLPAKNFKDTQLAKLNRRQLAGGVIVVLVYHTELSMWRNVPFPWIWRNKGGASWDLGEFKLYSDCRLALREALYDLALPIPLA